MLTHTEETCTLGILRDCAATGRGWRRRGVPGWLFTDELPTCGAAVLASLVHRGLVHTDQVAEPGRPPTLALHRITPVGADALARRESGRATVIDAPADPDPADAAVVYLPAGAWAALRGLQRVQHAGDGWASLAVVQEHAARAVSTGDLIYLLRRRLAVTARDAGRDRRFHVADAGAALRLLDLRTELYDLRGFHRVQATTVPEPHARPDLALRVGGHFFGSGG